MFSRHEDKELYEWQVVGVSWAIGRNMSERNQETCEEDSGQRKRQRTDGEDTSAFARECLIHLGLLVLSSS